jgi:MEMO1 family protein
MTLPPLRNIDVAPVEHNGETYVVLRDPEGYVETELMLSAPAFFIAAQLTGTSHVADIQKEFCGQYGIEVSESDIANVVDHLDQAGYLVSGAFFTLKRAVDDAFNENPVRPAYLAGKSYPAEPAALRAFIDDFFTRVGGPGQRPDGVPGAGDCLSCLVVPHIDFSRGGHAYAHGYLQLYRHAKPKTVLVFGVAHAAVPAPFVLTRKAFGTPLGTVATDDAVIDRLAQACAWDPFAHETVHRTEHSIEFQAVMLAYLYGSDVAIVPILCSGGPDLPGVTEPAATPAVTGFLDTCRRIVHESAGTTAVIAGADLAHVGARFGDAFDIDNGIVEQIGRRDREDLAFVTAMQPDAFYGSVMKDHNARRVCGLHCIYAALKTVQGVTDSGALLHYDYAHDPAGGIVSFAAGAFARTS